MNHVIASVSEAISIPISIRDCHVVLKVFRTPRNDKKERTLLNIYDNSQEAQVVSVSKDRSGNSRMGEDEKRGIRYCKLRFLSL